MSLFVILSFFSITYSSAQKKDSSMLFSLLIAPMDSIYNFGVAHKMEVDIVNDNTYYSDTSIANYFFRTLSQKIDPKRVVLVVENNVTKGNKDKIQTARNLWITPEMRKMGFNKWMASDNRKNKTAWYQHSLVSLTNFLSEYYENKYSKEEIDIFGFPQVVIKQKKKIPEMISDSVVSWLPIVIEVKSFETNIKRICSLLINKGYVPIVVAGRSHVLALNQPCMIQVPSNYDDAVRLIFSDLNFIKGEDFIIKEYILRYAKVKNKNLRK